MDGFPISIIGFFGAAEFRMKHDNLQCFFLGSFWWQGSIITVNIEGSQQPWMVSFTYPRKYHKVDHGKMVSEDWGFPKSWGYPQIIQVMDDQDLALVARGFGDPRWLKKQKPEYDEVCLRTQIMAQVPCNKARWMGGKQVLMLSLQENPSTSLISQTFVWGE
jgi:hypothetical protein